MNVQQILSKIETLPPMPGMAAQLLELSGDPDVNLAEVASRLEQDPAMTANLLRLCNSPFYGLRREVTSVRQATGLLGLKTVVQIAVTLLASRHLSPPQGGYCLAAGELWQSSLTSALAAELLAEETRYPDRSRAYTAGLLQDIGKIALAEFVGEEMARIRELVEKEGMSWEKAERQTLGMPHPETGALLLERWGFPPALVESVRTHHNPAAATLDPRLARLSHLADALAMTMGMGLGVDGLAYELDEEAVKEAALDDRTHFDGLLARLGERIRKAEALFRQPGGER